MKTKITKVLPHMTPQQQIAYANEILALTEEQIAIQQSLDVKDLARINGLLDAKVHYILVREGGELRLAGKA
jgi:hypothetical protein